jgi:hypothetical protein
MSMDFDDFAPGKSKRKTYDFTQARAGRSLWFATNTERNSAYQAFSRWKNRTGSTLVAKSVTVYDDDPRGAGFRLVFEGDADELRPVVRARLPYFANLDDTQADILRYTGIFTDADVTKAAMSWERFPQTVSDAKEVRAALFDGKTPLQISYCRSEGKPTIEEYRQSFDRQKRAEDSKAADRRRANDEALEQARREEREALSGLDQLS